ncbi:MAG: carbohydrate porin [Bacteroidales bacterium]
MKQHSLFFILSLFSIVIHAQEEGTKSHFTDGFEYGAAYYFDGMYNIYGGHATGFGHAGMGLVEINWNSNQAQLWNGTNVFISISPLHSSAPSDELTGDFQGISNIDAGGNYICFQELWIQQQIFTASLSIGLQDANALFAISEKGTLFLNGSFGVPSLIAENAIAPLFPLTSLGIHLEIPINKDISFNSGIYDGCPKDFETNPHNISWKLSEHDGMLSMNELVISHQSGYNKIGMFYHSGISTYNESEETYESIFENNYGIYAITDQEIWNNSENSKSISTFVQLAVSPQQTNEHNTYIGGGVVFEGFDSKQLSEFGIAVAHAQQKLETETETAIECTYAYKVTPHISIQPDIQYIINESISNACVGIMRCSIEF